MSSFKIKDLWLFRLILYFDHYKVEILLLDHLLNLPHCSSLSLDSKYKAGSDLTLQVSSPPGSSVTFIWKHTVNKQTRHGIYYRKFKSLNVKKVS